MRIMNDTSFVDETHEDAYTLSSTYHTVHDLDDGPLSAGVFEAIEDGVGVDPTTEPVPVSDEVDLDALDRLFEAECGDSYLSFPLWNLRVVVHSDGHIFIHPADA